MKVPVFIQLALRFLGFGSGKTVSNARKSLIGAMFGIGISIIPLIVVLVVADGMIEGITRRTVELGTGHLQLIDMTPSGRFKSCEEEIAVKQKLCSTLKDGFFKNAWIERQGSGLVIGKNGRSGGTIRAIEPEFFTENEEALRFIKTVEGKAEFEGENSAILGSKIAEQLGLTTGDTCRIITLFKASGKKPVPKISSFKVAGIISSGYRELDALWVFIPLSRGTKIMSLESSLTSVLVSTAAPFNEEKTARLKNGLYALLPESFSVFTWYDLNRSTFVSFKTTKNILLFIMFLIVLVASVNISSAVVMLVMERQRDIAILKAAGTDPFYITVTFLTAGFLTALGGIIIGMPLGILTALHINGLFSAIEHILNYCQRFLYLAFYKDAAVMEISLLNPEYYLDHIPVTLNFKELYIITVSMLVLAVIVCIIPAVKAGNEKPIEIMRKI